MNPDRVLTLLGWMRVSAYNHPNTVILPDGTYPPGGMYLVKVLRREDELRAVLSDRSGEYYLARVELRGEHRLVFVVLARAAHQATCDEATALWRADLAQYGGGEWSEFPLRSFSERRASARPGEPAS